jgi:hypothetical protein
VRSRRVRVLYYPSVGALAVLACLALVIVAAGVPAAAVARGDAAAFLVGTWVLGLAEIVVLAAVLSLFDAFTLAWLLAAAAVWCAVALAVARARDVRLPPLGPQRRAAGEILRDPALALLAGANVVVLGYSTALALFTPPSEDDALTYHLIRSAFWKQDHAIGWIHDTIDLRANVSPPVAEIAVAAAMVLDQGERFVALPQLTALPIAGIAVFGIGRRVGLGRRAAALGGLAVPLLPDGLIQASTAMNDVVPAALAAAVALFVLRAGTADVAVAAIALTLLLGTKTAAVFVLPSLALLVVVTLPARRWPALGAVGVAALVVGSGWYVVNLVETGDASGGLDSEHLSTDGLDPVAALARAMRYTTSAIELPGGVGRDKYLYVLAGIALVAVSVALRRRTLLWSGLLVGSVPLVLALRRGADELYTRGWYRLGRRDLSGLDPGDFSGSISATGYTWYGPVGLALVVAALVVVLVRLRRRRPGAVTQLVLASAPVVTLVLFAIALAWNGAYGRLLFPAVALSAAVWGVVYPWRSGTVAIAVTSTIVAVTSLVWWNKKPLGLPLLESARGSVWTTPRAQVQEVLDGSAPFLAFFDRTVPTDAHVAVASGLPPYSLFGSRLERTIRALPDLSGPVPGDWLVVGHGQRPPCAADWQLVPGPPSSQFDLLRRVGADCAS